MKTSSLWMIAAVCFIAPTSVAQARSAYDGSWDLAFVTQKGACDPSYNFTVNLSDGILTHPNLVKRQIGFRSGLGDGSTQIRSRHGQAFRNVRSRKMERQLGKCAMLGLLDRATQLTEFKNETPCSESLARGSFGHDRHGRDAPVRSRRTTERTLLPPNDIARIGNGHE
jgi:hypothetical protein